MASSNKSRLGRGLGGIISGSTKATPVAKDTPPAPAEPAPAPAPAEPVSTAATGYREIPVDAVVPSPFQARKEMDAEALRELAESIRSEGLLQPITVRPRGRQFELIAGERRWRACKSIGMRAITAHVIEAGDSSSAVKSLIENLQRRDLNPIEEARGYGSLMADFHLTQDQVSERVGKPRPTIANALRLLQLSREIQGYVAKGMMSQGHAKVLLGIDDATQRDLLARRVVESGMSVRETEIQVARLKNIAPKTSQRPAQESETAVIRDIEKRLATHLNARVSLKHTAKKGRISIDYFGNEDLQRLLERLGMKS